MPWSSLLDLKGIFNNELSSFLWLPIALLLAGAYKVSRKALSFVGLSAISKVMACTAVVYLCLMLSLGGAHWVPMSLAFAVLAGLLYLSLSGFAKTLISDAHSSVRTGVSFSASLKRANRSFSFLGIGADKLTRDPAFENAMQRCAGAGRTARFLLSPVDNPLLEQLAMQHGLGSSEYKDRVTDSLKRLAKLKVRRGLNLEVRQYAANSAHDLQQFRLLFIDDDICLLSWTVWGTHAGTDNPQVVLRRGQDQGKERRLYSAFEAYFEAAWKSSTPVDLSKI